MARISPLLAHHIAAGARLLPYGPADSGIELVESFAPFGLEYAALRTTAAMLDTPSRGIVRLAGADRIAFLQRMITGDMRGLNAWNSRRAFWLNRKGRIDADLLVIESASDQLSELGSSQSTLLELDAHAVTRAVETLGAFVIADDVTFDDLTETTHQLQIHGPASLAIVAQRASAIAGPAVLELADGQACSVHISTDRGAIPATIIRQDLTGDPGLSIFCAAAAASAVYEALSELPPSPTSPGGALQPRPDSQPRLARRIGWHAFNVARIEAGTPLYNIDFGPTSLPHETGDEVLGSRVSFTKGCYLGQEVVARMNALGKPKQRLVGLDLLDSASNPDAQPSTGSLVFSSDDANIPPVGAITSSGVSPMLGGRIVCFAMVKSANASPGADLFVQPSPGVPLAPAKVRERLRSWSRP
jgi:folate-binding protein YgfZ